MKQSYIDITKRISDPPRWWDEAGVPRYERFHPKWLNDIYAHEAALLLIACQNCGRRFRVAVSLYGVERWHRVRDGSMKQSPSLARRILDNTIYYGDPPNTINCCPGGATMSSESLKVLQYWRKGNRKQLWDWVRHPKLERCVRNVGAY